MFRRWNRPSRHKVKAYQVAPNTAEATLKQLNQRFPDSSGVHITYDPRTSQVLVVGSDTVQPQIAEFLQPCAAGESPIQNVRPAPAAGGSETSGATARGPKVVPLHHMTGREFEATLSNSLGRVLPVTEEHGGEWARYTLDTRGGSVAIVIDRKANQVALEGPVRLADAWARVIESLDARPQHSPDDTRVIPLTTARTSDVLKAMSALREHGTATISTVGQTGSHGGGDTSSGRLISMIFQPKDGDNSSRSPLLVAQAQDQQQGQPDQNQTPDENQPQATPEGEASAGELQGPVRIEFLEGLDVIVLTGHPKDVEKVRAIIEEIQRLSQQTQPKIEIYPLKYVSGPQISTLVQSIYDSNFGHAFGPDHDYAIGQAKLAVIDWPRRGCHCGDRTDSKTR